MSDRYEITPIARGRLLIRDNATTKRFRMVEACKRLNEQDAEIKRLTAILAGREVLSAEGQAAGKQDHPLSGIFGTDARRLAEPGVPGLDGGEYAEG